MMQDDHTPNPGIEIRLRTDLHETLKRAELEPRAAEAISAAVKDLMTELGLPGAPRISLQAGAVGEIGSPLMTLQVSDKTLGSETNLENRILAVVSERLLQPGESVSALFSSIAKSEQQPADDTRRVVSWLALLARSLLVDHPEVLLDREIISALESNWTGSGSEAKLEFRDAEWLSEVLPTLLQAHLSLSDTGFVLKALQNEQQDEGMQAAEAAVVALLPETIGLVIPRHILRDYTLADVQMMPDPQSVSPPTPTVKSANAFDEMERQVFTEYGLTLPRLEFEVEEGTENFFRFRINRLSSPPWPALPDGQMLVNANPENLRAMGIVTTPVLNPVDGRVSGLVPAGDNRAAQAGYWTWNGIEYLALCLTDQLRAWRSSLIHLNKTNSLLEEVNATEPELVGLVRARYGDKRGQAILTRVLRSLVEQRVSLALLPRVLEALLDAQVIGIPSADWTVVGNAIPVVGDTAGEPLQDPETLVRYVCWRLYEAPLSFAPVERARRPGPLPEKYAEPLTLEQKLQELFKLYSREEIDTFTTWFALALSMNDADNLADFYKEKVNALWKQLGVTNETPSETRTQRLADYMKQNPYNPQLFQDFLATSSANVPANIDAFTTFQPAKYSIGQDADYS